MDSPEVQPEEEYKRARSQYSQYASMWAGKWMQTSTNTVKQEKVAGSSPATTTTTVPTSSYPSSFTETLPFSQYESGGGGTGGGSYSGQSPPGTGSPASLAGEQYYGPAHPYSQYAAAASYGVNYGYSGPGQGGLGHK